MKFDRNQIEMASIIKESIPEVNGLGFLKKPSEGTKVAAVASSSKISTEKEEGHLTIIVEFGGGLDLLFSKKSRHILYLPPTIPTSSDSTETKSIDVQYLIKYLAEHLLQEREELFRENDTVRPGILVLINDTDWELEGETEYVLQDNDEVVFISTLHGG